MNYIDTFILVAEDCPAKSGIVPQPKANKQTVATIHYDMLAGHPYKHTQEDVLFGTFVRHKDVPAKDLKARGRAMREEFFSKDQPCLRTSPLAKTYGWGFHFDSGGKVALYPMESAEYKKLAKGASKTLKALRSSRK
jgi:uncharacterized protein DUF6157